MGVNDPEKKVAGDVESGSPPSSHDGDVQTGEVNGLHRELKGRHMQMIAIGGSIGAGLFVGSGGALNSGGPASLIIDFIIIGVMLLLTVNAMGELAGMLSILKICPSRRGLLLTSVCQLSTLSLDPFTITQFASSILLGVLPWVGIMP